MMATRSRKGEEVKATTAPRLIDCKGTRAKPAAPVCVARSGSLSVQNSQAQSPAEIVNACVGTGGWGRRVVQIWVTATSRENTPWAAAHVHDLRQTNECKPTEGHALSNLLASLSGRCRPGGTLGCTSCSKGGRLQPQCTCHGVGTTKHMDHTCHVATSATAALYKCMCSLKQQGVGSHGSQRKRVVREVGGLGC